MKVYEASTNPSLPVEKGSTIKQSKSPSPDRAPGKVMFGLESQSANLWPQRWLGLSDPGNASCPLWATLSCTWFATNSNLCCPRLNPNATLFKAHLIANINISFPNACLLPLFPCLSAPTRPAGALIMWAGFNSISHRISCVMSTGNFSSRMACAVAVALAIVVALWWKRSNEKKETATWQKTSKACLMFNCLADIELQSW